MEIFVFGSNLGGFHGAGSAHHAYCKHGAEMNIGVGLAGNSYAIPTKDSNIEVLPIEVIEKYVRQFIHFAKMHPEMKFNIVAIGCGLAGFKPEQIAPMFEGCPENCNLPNDFVEHLGIKK